MSWFLARELLLDVALDCRTNYEWLEIRGWSLYNALDSPFQNLWVVMNTDMGASEERWMLAAATPWTGLSLSSDLLYSGKLLRAMGFTAVGRLSKNRNRQLQNFLLCCQVSAALYDLLLAVSSSQFQAIHCCYCYWWCYDCFCDRLTSRELTSFKLLESR